MTKKFKYWLEKRRLRKNKQVGEACANADSKNAKQNLKLCLDTYEDFQALGISRKDLEEINKPLVQSLVDFFR